MDMEFMMGAPHGWQCPICKRVYSPTTPCCFYCGESMKVDVITQKRLPNTSTTPLDLNYKDHPCTYGT